jgi:hypothetical protein
MPLTPFIFFSNIEHNMAFAVVRQKVVYLLRCDLRNFFARVGHNLLKRLGHDSSFLDLEGLS